MINQHIKKHYIVYLFFFVMFFAFPSQSNPFFNLTALAQDDLCYFNAKESVKDPGGCGKDMDVEIREVKRESNKSVVQEKVIKRGSVAGLSMFNICSFSNIAKKRGYRYIEYLSEKDLKDCPECQWKKEYVIAFSSIKPKSNDKVLDINQFSQVCGFLPIPSTEIHGAVYFGNLVKTKQLIESNRGLINLKDEQDYQPLHIAAIEGYREIVEYLIKAGADINARGMYGWTPLNVAVRFNQKEIVKLLLSHKADPFIKMDNGNTPLHSAAYRNYVELAELFINIGIDINVTDDDGNTPLLGAASRGHIQMVRYLLLKGALPNLKNKSGQTPLFFAEQGKYSAVVDELKKYK